MKKILAWLLVLVMVLGLCSCKKDDTSDKDTRKNTQEVIAAYTSEYPYLEVITDRYEYSSVRYVTSTGSAYAANEYRTELEGTSGSLISDRELAAHSLTNVVEIERGDINNNTGLIALHSDGTVSVFDSYNDTTKFHHARQWTDIIAISVTNSHLVGLKSDGTVIATGGNDDGQCNVEGWRDIIAIGTAEPEIGRVCGVTYGLRKDGTVISTEEGFNTSSWTDIVAIAATRNFVMGLKADGTVMVAGDDHYGETKISDWTDIVAIKAYPGLSIGIKADGTVVSAGDDYVITKYLKDIKLKVK